MTLKTSLGIVYTFTIEDRIYTITLTTNKTYMVRYEKISKIGGENERIR